MPSSSLRSADKPRPLSRTSSFSCPFSRRERNSIRPGLVRGTVDHVRVITEPARGNAVTLPFKDAMCCAIHVDDMAEVLARVLLADQSAHRVYNSGGTAISLGEIAAIVRSYLPDASISFDNETGARADNSTYLLDNSRLVAEFAVQYPPFRERVLQIINDVRRDNGVSPIE